jgi:hypothetical protein
MRIRLSEEAGAAMNPAEDKLSRPRGDDELHDLAQSRSLRRKLVFWRRTAWLLFGIVVIIGVVFWQRAELHRRACGRTLEYYGRLAQKSQLEKEPARLLQLQWLHLEQGRQTYSPAHYALVIDNWNQTPQAGESLNLAICGDPHSTLIGEGRNVLVRDQSGYHVEWLKEESAKSIVATASPEPQTGH